MDKIQTTPAVTLDALPGRWWAQLAAVLLIIVELGWVVPWYRTVIQVSSVASVSLSALVLGGIMLASYALAQAMEQLRLLRNVQIAGLGLMLAASLLLAESVLLRNPALSMVSGLVTLDPGALLVLFTVLWVWQRGTSLAREAIRPFTAWRRFEFGMLMFMAHILIVNQLGDEGPGLGWYVFFLFSGFLAVIFARIAYVGLSKGVVKNPFDRRWLASTLGILGLAVLFSAGLSSLVTGQYQSFLEWLAQFIKMVVAVFVFLASLPGLAVSYLITPFLPWLRLLFSSRSGTPLAEDPGLGPYPFGEMIPQAKPIPGYLQSLIFWAVILILLSVLFIRMRRSILRRKEAGTDSQESLLKQGEARKLLRQALQDTLDNLAAYFRPVQRRVAAARIRRIYAELMDMCAALNRPRPASKTPLEFLPLMGEFLSPVKEDLDLVTHAYSRVRYGLLPENRAEVELVEQAWQRIQAEGQRLKKLGWHKLQTAEVKDIQRTGI